MIKEIYSWLLFTTAITLEFIVGGISYGIFK